MLKNVPSSTGRFLASPKYCDSASSILIAWKNKNSSLIYQVYQIICYSKYKKIASKEFYLLKF